jgi:hypothetical protein
MTGRLAALAAVVLAAAATLAPSVPGARTDVRIDVVSVSPRPPQAAKAFELVARVDFAPAPGSIHSSVWIGGTRYRNIRLRWDSPIARCTFVVPAGTRGKRLTVALDAVLGGSHSRTAMTFTVR